MENEFNLTLMCGTDCRPTFGVPNKGRDSQCRGTPPLYIVSVVHERLPFLVLQDRAVPWASPTPLARNDARPATFHHGLAATIQVWPNDAPRSTYTNVVSAVLPTTTEVKRHEEIVVAILSNYGRRFNRARQLRGSRTAGEGV